MYGKQRRSAIAAGVAAICLATAAQAQWTSFVIRNSGGGTPPTITDQGGGTLEFFVTESGMKAGWGSSALDGRQVGDIAAAGITRLDDTTRFSAGSGPATAPYFNIWVTDGNGNYAVIANEPSNPAFQPLFIDNGDGTKTYDLSYADLADKTAKVYETPGAGTGTSWVHTLCGPPPLTFADVAALTVEAPPASYITNPANAVGSGAPDELGTNIAYGFTWVFGDTLSNYVSGDPGFLVTAPALEAVPEPTLTLAAVDSCLGVGENQLVVEIRMANAPTEIVGGQFFMEYDTTKLSYVDGVPGDAPFTDELYDFESAGQLIYAVNIDPDGVGTDADTVMARLTFNVLGELCKEDGLVTFRTNTPPTRITNDGGMDVQPVLIDLGPVTNDNTAPTIACPADIVLENDPGECSAVLTEVETFDSPVPLCTPDTPSPGCWYTDRYTPAFFEQTVFGGENVLRHGLLGADLQTSAFHNTQGRKYDIDLPPGATLAADIYVPSAWATMEIRAGLWGTAVDGSSGVAEYPIIEFATVEGSGTYDPRFRVWDEDTVDYWVDLATPVTFDAWHTFEIVFTGTTFEYYLDGVLVYTDATADGAVRIANVILNAKNYGADYDVYWDNITLGPAGPIAEDNCCVASVVGTRNDGLPLSDPYPVGDTIITWTATDCCGAATSCTQLVTVEDTEAPDVTVGSIDSCYDTAADAEADALAATTATDNCTAVGDLVYAVTTTGDCSASVQVSVTDEAGNTAYALYTTRIDSTPPTISGIADISVSNDAGVCEAVVTWADPVVTDNCDVSSGYFEGFEDPGFVAPPITGGLPSWQSYYSFVDRVVSGTDGLTSPEGNAHAAITPNPNALWSGAFSRLDGYRSNFGGGFVSSVDVYLDLADPAVAAGTYGFDLSTAASRQTGSHLRDFIFHAAAYGAGGPIYIAGSNNTNFVQIGNLNTYANHYEVTASGWYTFEWVFRDAGDGSLAVDLNLRDSGGTLLFTETRNNPADDIATTVGGNRYMWFTFVATDYLAIDATSVEYAAAPLTVDVTPASGSTFPVGTTPVTVTATDSCGNETIETFDVTVTDDELPIITCPAAVTVNADAGGCDADASNVPLGMATATDNCGVASITSDAPATFPQGATIVTWTATDIHGNTATCTQTVTVLAANELVVDVELDGVDEADPLSGDVLERCITFELLPTGGGSAVVVEATLEFVDGLAAATIEIPCGDYTCITARDTLHTLQRRDDDDFGVAGTQYVADFTSTGSLDNDALLGGNFNDDPYIDILDFGTMVGQYNTAIGADTPCGTVAPHTDASGDGIVFTEDFTFIQTQFLFASEADCVGSPSPFAAMAAPAGPVTSITVEELIARGLEDLVVADLTGDGVLDVADMEAFANGPAQYARGDLNCDGIVDTYDIDAFVQAIADADVYATQYPDCDVNLADCNLDGSVDTYDIDAFVELLAY